MAVQAITKYSAADGSIYDTHAEALAADARFKALAAMKSAFQTANVNGTVATWDRDFIGNPKALLALRAACTSALTYHRNHGRLRKAATKV